MYLGIRSKFVRNELKKTAWKNREYISHLMDIEKFATTGYCSTGADYIEHILKNKYPQQWKAIWMELNPNRYKERIEESRKEERQHLRGLAKIENEEKEELIGNKREWKKIKLS